MMATSRIYRRCVSSHCSSSTSAGSLTSDECIQISTEFPNGEFDRSFSSVAAFQPIMWQPRHSITRRTAKVAREVQCVWNSRLGSSTRIVQADKIKLLFNDMKLFPSPSQGCNLCSRIYRRDYFTRLLEKHGYEKAIRDKKMSRGLSKHEVFLGGSCNPTTWRQDEAIPLLDKLGITFYNPQVSEWSEELIELEHRAKEEADVLLFVIDNKTRNVVGTVETSYFAGTQRKLALVIYPYDGPGQSISCEKLSQQEYEDLKVTLSLVSQLLEKRGIPVFETIPDAIEFTAKMLKSDSLFPIQKEASCKLLKIKEAFESIDTEKCGQINTTDVVKAIKMLTNQLVRCSARVSKNITQQIGNNVNGKNNKCSKVSFEEFCNIVSELKICDDEYFSDDASESKSKCFNFFRSLSTPHEVLNSNGFNTPIDIYLGGECHKYCDWRRKIAIPLIRKSCVTFFNPESVRNSTQPLLSSEFDVIKRSTVLLFVITSTSRSIFTMSMASFYIAVGANIVLCIQQLPENCVLGSEKLSRFAINDYNRGRLYLADLAKRENIPVFSSIEEAVNLAISKCIK